MRIILTDDVVGLGDIGETVNVKPGYARNFLIPRGMAIETGSSSAKEAAHRSRQIEAKRRRMKGTAEEKAKNLQGSEVRMELRGGAHGKVFGSIVARDIAAKLAEMGYELDRRRVLLTEPIKRVGEHAVRIKLHQEVETEIKVIVTARESTRDEEDADVSAAKASIEEQSEKQNEKSAARDESSEEDESAE